MSICGFTGKGPKITARGRHYYGENHVLAVGMHELAGTRVRLQRMNDARIFSGWVEVSVGMLLHLTILQNDDVNDGDLFFCEAHTYSSRVSFKATIERTLGVGANKRYVMRLKTEPNVVPGTENPRFRVPSFPGTLTLSEGTQQINMIDVSVAGLGALCDIEHKRGVQGDICLSTPCGTVEAKVEVMHCTHLPDIDQYRLGFSIKGISRETAESWVKFVRMVACGERSAA